MIELIIFDFDGTLVDSMWVWQEVDRQFLKNREIKVPQNLQNNISGLSFTETAYYFKDRFNLDESIDDIKKEWLSLSKKLYRTKVSFKKNAIKIIKYLYKKNKIICIASSNHKQIINSFLKQKKIDRYFKKVITGCEVEKGKNSPNIYRQICKDLNVEYKNILLIDDIMESIKTASSLGIKTAAIFDKYTYKDENLEGKADHYIYDLIEIKDILGNYSSGG
ncbi:MAG: HAD family phosphatase [Candidatus Mcinerneyibacterium aminivorans]|uniref:HAD family phosphatase n=1 Tax=Candidatus Mcinerneyibacterium aminivorans TaxID=2703815 RepID=A0A5D0MKD1_9BACT|nr:MAG: HAD family phosphatase [Candidatus Mcinerneyibacterium aminivorans]